MKADNHMIHEPQTGYGFIIHDEAANELLTFVESDNPERTFMSLEEAHNSGRTTIRELQADGQSISDTYGIVSVTARLTSWVTILD